MPQTIAQCPKLRRQRRSILDDGFDYELGAAERGGKRCRLCAVVRLDRSAHDDGQSPSAVVSISLSSPRFAAFDENMRPTCASWLRSHASISLRWPPVGRAQRRFFNALLSSPTHQYSLVTMSDQPCRPGRVKVKISIVRPCFGPVALCRSRSNSTPSWVQCERFKPGLVRLRRRSNSRKKDGWAKLFMTHPAVSMRRCTENPAECDAESPRHPPTATSRDRSHQPNSSRINGRLKGDSIPVVSLTYNVRCRGEQANIEASG